MKTLHSAIVLVLGSTLVTPVLAGVNDDLFQVITDNALLRHTSCGAFDFGSLTARAPIVRGKTAKVRIQKNFVDVGLETASVSSCGGKCSANITHKGGVTQKGFAEIDLVVNGDAPLGNATLVMHYFGGGTGSYDLLIVPDSRIDSVTAANVSNTGDHITFRGSALDRFPATLISVNHNFTRISESDTTLVLAPAQRICANQTVTLRMPLEAARSACHVDAPQFNIVRDPACAVASGSTPSLPHAPASGATVQLPNLLPALVTPTVLTRALGATISTTRGGMVAVNNFFCANLAANVVTTVNVPKLTWGVSGVNIEAVNTRFDTQLLDADANRVLDTLTLPLGFPANTPLVQRDNYPGRATTLRVVRDPRFQLGAAQQTTIGCFTEPGSTPTLDPKTLLIRVDPDNRIDEGSRENDNDLRF